MKRLLLVGMGLLALAGCSGGGTTVTVSANSADSNQPMRDGNVVSTDTSPVSTSPVSTPDAPTVNPTDVQAAGSTDTPAASSTDSPPAPRDGHMSEQ